MDSFPFLRALIDRTNRTKGPSTILGQRARGFTLVEMVVVLAIIIIITSIVITGQSAYNESLLLTDTAYTVAFSIRQAQSLGLSSRNYGAPGTGQNVGYGVNFSSGSSDSYTFFADTYNYPLPIPTECTVGASGTPEEKPGNCRFDAGDDGIVQTYSFSRGYRISKFCGKAGQVLRCSDDNGQPLQSLDLVFMRPNTISVLTGTRHPNQHISFDCAQIHVAAPTGGVERVIRVSKLGEVSMGQLCP